MYIWHLSVEYSSKGLGNGGKHNQLLNMNGGNRGKHYMPRKKIINRRKNGTYEEVLLRVTTCAQSLCGQLNSARHECSICICICMMSALFMQITIAGLHVIYLRVYKTCSLTELDAWTGHVPDICLICEQLD